MGATVKSTPQSRPYVALLRLFGGASYLVCLVAPLACEFPKKVTAESLTFVNNDDGTTTDLLTHRVWQSGALTQPTDFVTALRYCDDLTLAGHDTWALPSETEYSDLVTSNAMNCGPNNVSNLETPPVDDQAVTHMEYTGSVTECGSGVPYFTLPEFDANGEIIKYRFWSSTVEREPTRPIATVFSTKNFAYVSHKSIFHSELARCILLQGTATDQDANPILVTTNSTSVPPESVISVSAINETRFPALSTNFSFAPYYYVDNPDQTWTLPIVSRNQTEMQVVLPYGTPGNSISIYLLSQVLPQADSQFEITSSSHFSNTIKIDFIEGDPLYPPNQVDDRILGNWIPQNTIASGTYEPSVTDPNDHHSDLIALAITIDGLQWTYDDRTYTWPHYDEDWLSDKTSSIEMKDGLIKLIGYHFITDYLPESGTSVYIQEDFNYAFDLTIPNLLWISNANIGPPFAYGDPYCREGYDC